MLEETISKLERLKEGATQVISRTAVYGTGVAFSLGLIIRGCDYKPHHYLVQGGRALAAATAWYAGSCGGEETEEKCRTNRDCLNQCIDYVMDDGCDYTNPSPGQVEQCQELGIQRCHERYSSGTLYCGRRCGERTVPDCRDPNDSYCGQERMEAYCENACIGQ